MEIREQKDKKVAQNDNKKKETRFDKTATVEARPVSLMKRGNTIKNLEDTLKSPAANKTTIQADAAASLQTSR